MSNGSDERVWQFPISDDQQFRKNGIIYFDERAAEMAKRVGCRLLGIKSVQLETAPGGKWKIRGTVILKSVRAHA